MYASSNGTSTGNESLVLDWGTTSQITPNKRNIQEARNCHVPILIVDNSEVDACRRDIQNVSWSGEDGVTNVSLSNTLVTPRLLMSVLSVPALASKEICTLFTPQRPLLIDMHDDFRIIGYAPNHANGLYYISGSDENVCNGAVTDDDFNH